MTQREIDHAAAIIRATPIELEPEQQPAEPDPFWLWDVPAIVAVIVIAVAFVWAISRLPR
jgi:hypothetical protein